MDPVTQMLFIVAIKGGAVAEVAAYLAGLGFVERMAFWASIGVNVLRNLGIV